MFFVGSMCIKNVVSHSSLHNIVSAWLVTSHTQQGLEAGPALLREVVNVRMFKHLLEPTGILEKLS